MRSPNNFPTPAIFLLAVLALTLGTMSVSAADQTFSSDGYTVDIVGSSGKMKLSVDDTNAFISIEQDDLAEVGTNTHAVPSWASQSIDWGTSDCGDKDSEYEALRVCDELTVKIGSNSVNAPTAQFYTQAKLTNASYYFGCACSNETTPALTRAAAAVTDKVRPKFSDNYVPNRNGFCFSCRNRCIDCTYTAETNQTNATASCEVSSFDTGDGCPEFTLLTNPGTEPKSDSDASLCEYTDDDDVCFCVGATSSVACTNDACSAGMIKVESFSTSGVLAENSYDQTNFKSSDCQYQAEHHLKFGIRVDNWEWQEGSGSLLTYGTVIKGGNGNSDSSKDSEPKGDSTVSYGNGLQLISNPDYTRCWGGENCPDDDGDYEVPDCSDEVEAESSGCCIERGNVQTAVTTQGSKDIVTYTFLQSHGASGVCYDPSIGENPERPDDNGATTAGMSSSLLSCGIVILVSLIAELW